MFDVLTKFQKNFLSYALDNLFSKYPDGQMDRVIAIYTFMHLNGFCFCPVTSPIGAEKLCAVGTSAQKGDRSGRRLGVSGVWVEPQQLDGGQAPITLRTISVHCFNYKV